jgi:deoxyribodipyrimidine photo-lyase
MKKSLIWFRNDLRTRDNRTLAAATADTQETVGVYFLASSSNTISRLFLLQSLRSLKEKLEKLNILLVVIELPGSSYEAQCSTAAEILFQFSTIGSRELYFTAEENFVDAQTETLFCTKLDPKKVHAFHQRTLLEETGLPFSCTQLPHIFTDFRKAVELTPPVAPETPPLSRQPNSAQPFWSRILGELGAKEIFLPENQECSSFPFQIQAGEDAALKRLEEYFFETQSIGHYKESRNGMLNKNDSCKLSPWLAVGTLSPRTVYFTLKAYESKIKANESTRWFFYELLWRDYFKFLARSIGPKFFDPNGLRSEKVCWSENRELFSAWREGKTGEPFVDANMRELLKTGWMSNRGRQNVASFLAKTLRIDWTWGAQWFNHHLLDSDRESNWGNWAYLAGVGTDPRDRQFNISRQAQMYDAEGKYRKLWLSE